MMNIPTFFKVFGIHILFSVIFVVLLIYFIIKRVKDKKKENFENRDN